MVLAESTRPSLTFRRGPQTLQLGLPCSGQSLPATPLCPGGIYHLHFTHSSWAPLTRFWNMSAWSTEQVSWCSSDSSWWLWVLETWRVTRLSLLAALITRKPLLGQNRVSRAKASERDLGLMACWGLRSSSASWRPRAGCKVPETKCLSCVALQFPSSASGLYPWWRQELHPTRCLFTL